MGSGNHGNQGVMTTQIKVALQVMIQADNVVTKAKSLTLDNVEMQLLV